MVSRKGQSIRFNANDEALRPMGRDTSGVIGMRFPDGDELLEMDVCATGPTSWRSPTAGTPSAPRLTRTPCRAARPGVFTARIIDARGYWSAR